MVVILPIEAVRIPSLIQPRQKAILRSRKISGVSRNPQYTNPMNCGQHDMHLRMERPADHVY